MAYLGKLTIRSHKGVTTARTKVLRVVELATGDAILGTRLATRFSQACKMLLRSNAEVQLSATLNAQALELSLRANGDEVLISELVYGSYAELDALRAIMQTKDSEQLAEELQLKAGELNIARDIQMSMVPLEFPAFPNRPEFSIHATLEPAREVGGDFYDFFLIDDDHLCFCVGDVSDKGAGAALFMAVTTTLIKTHAAVDSSPASIMTAVSDALAQNNESSMFVTIFLAILDLRTGDMVYCNAGHNPPYIKKQSGELVMLDKRHGLVAGALGGVTYAEDVIRLENGDCVVAFTDGVTESFDADGELYSDPRLLSLLEDSTWDSSERAVQLVYGSVVEHRGDADQSDDITVLSMVFLGTPEMARERLELVMVNELAEIGRVLESLDEFAKSNGLDDAIRRPVLLAVDDLLNNVLSYAFEDAATHEISLAVELSGHRLSVTMSDDGTPFNPFGAEVPEISTGLTDPDVGGLGLHLVRTLMDDYRYERRAGRNIVTIARNLDADDEALREPRQEIR